MCFFVWTFDGAASAQKRPEALISLPENEHAILVEKKSQTLFLYTQKGDELSVSFQVDCSTGEAPGMKLKAGDKKTPEGVYFLIDEYEDRYLTPIYGKKAFPTDYPNLVDKREGKKGSAIWIHGTNKVLKPMDSNGCVTLENEDILKLAEYITLDSTPVIMVEEIEYADPDDLDKIKSRISALLDRWKMALKKESYHVFLSFYSPTYLPDIQWWEDWTIVREQIHGLDPGFELTIERPGLYRHGDLIVVLFDSYLKLNNEKLFLGKRKLFFKSQEEQFKIVGDTFQRKPEKFTESPSPLVAVSKTKIEPVMDPSSVLKTVEQWIAAWTAKDMDTYAYFYAKDFFSDGLNKRQWIRKKRRLAKKYNYINVSGENFKVKTTGGRSEVSFFQTYESSGFSTRGIKTLTLVDEGGKWKIYRESWKKK